MGELCESVYQGMLSRIPDGEMLLFDEGVHPAMLSNAEQFAEKAAEFLG